MDPFVNLSRRERQIMAILYRRRESTAAEVQERLPDPPSNSAVRSALALLEERGLVEHERQGRRYVFRPVMPREEVTMEALDQMLRTFFGGSPVRAAAALMQRAEYVSEADYAELRQLLDRARQGRAADG